MKSKEPLIIIPCLGVAAGALLALASDSIPAVGESRATGEQPISSNEEDFTADRRMGFRYDDNPLYVERNDTPSTYELDEPLSFLPDGAAPLKGHEHYPPGTPNPFMDPIDVRSVGQDYVRYTYRDGTSFLCHKKDTLALTCNKDE